MNSEVLLKWCAAITRGLRDIGAEFTEKSKLWLFGLFFLGGPILGVSAILALGYEAYYYLRYGMSIDLTVISLAREYYCPRGACVQDALGVWLYHPTDWIGLHVLLSYTHVSVLLILVGLLFLGMAIKLGGGKT